MFVSGSLAFALVRGLETLAARGTLKQVFLLLSSKNPLPRTSSTLTDAEQLVCRKIVHMSTGPLFVLTWPLFRCLLTNSQTNLKLCYGQHCKCCMLHSAGFSARWFAASVPFFNGVRWVRACVALWISGSLQQISQALVLLQTVADSLRGHAKRTYNQSSEPLWQQVSHHVCTCCTYRPGPCNTTTLCTLHQQPTDCQVLSPCCMPQRWSTPN